MGNAEAAELQPDLQQEQQQEQEPEQEPLAKRQRSEPASYPRGTVKQVKVFNFMTYGEPAVTIKPGARLNLVLGPNGTGKSSLVCALCIGLGGSTKLLGRADNAKDYIRRGADKGWVETTLSGGPGGRDHVIRCELAKEADGYKTHWRINGCSKAKRDVAELVASLNIQFDNLCQFLPQDKVVEFARMNAHELLVATEKAIGDASLHADHAALISLRGSAKEAEVAAAALGSKVAQLEAENAKAERDYQRHNKRRQLTEAIALMETKLAWMGVKDAQDEARAAKEAAREAQQAYDAARDAAKEDEGPAKRLSREVAAAKEAVVSLTRAGRQESEAAKRAADGLLKQDEAVRELRVKLDGLQAASEKAAAEKAKIRERLAKGQAALDSLPPPPDHSEQLQLLTEQLGATREQLAGLEDERAQLDNDMTLARTEESRIAGALRQCGNARYQRLQALRSRPGMDQLEAATRWVEAAAAGGRFRGPVAGPLGLDMRLRDPGCARYLEQATFRHLCDFAVTCQADADLLMGEFKKQGWRSNAVAVTTDISTPLVSNAQQYAQYGVTCSLDEVYDAPPLVKHALAAMANLDRVYVMARHDMGAVKALMDAHAVGRVFTPELAVNYIPSAHGGSEDGSLQTSGLFNPRVLATGGGAELDERKAQLQAQLEGVHARISQLTDALAATAAKEAPLQQALDELQQKKQALQNETNAALQKRAALQRSLKGGATMLQQMEARPDPLLQAPALKAQLAAALAAHFATLGQQLAATRAQWDVMQRHVAAELAWREKEMQARGLADAAEARRAALGALKAAADAAVARAKTAGERFRRRKEVVEVQHPLSDDMRAAFAELPDTRDELEAEKAAREAERSSIAVNNPRVVEEYEARAKAAAQAAEQLASVRAALDTTNAQIEEIKGRWLPELSRVVGVINTSFSSNFRDIGCAGEVLLGTHEDFDQFSIQIKVKFRENEELQLLTAHRQSGGERSVSTILYLIALQGVTVTPFRVVDEINQGMDPVNERKVFCQLVEASCRPGTPQCFLLTPKLLPDLPFTEDITVLNIFNGPMISGEVAGGDSRELLFGRTGLAALRGVPVAS